MEVWCLGMRWIMRRILLSTAMVTIVLAGGLGSAGFGQATAPAVSADMTVTRESMGRIPAEGTARFRLVVNSDLSKVAAMDTWTEDGVTRWYVVENSLVWEFYTDVDAASAQYARDGKQLSLLARHDDRWFLITDNKDMRPLGPEPCRGLAFSRDGKHDACIQTLDAGQRVLLDGKPAAVNGEPMVFAEVTALAFDEAGRLAFTGRSLGNAYAVLDGKILGKVGADRVLPAAFSADGKHVRWAAAAYVNGNTRLMQMNDGESARTYEVPGILVTTLAQSANGEHLAWAEVRKDKSWVVVDGVDQKGLAKEVREIVVGSDGGHIAWSGTDVDGVNYVTLDGKGWATQKIAASRLSMGTDGKTVTLQDAKGRYDWAFVSGGWRQQVVATGGDEGIQVEASWIIATNGVYVDNGHFLEARIGDSQTAYILTDEVVPVQVGDKKLNEITRLVVRVKGK